MTDPVANTSRSYDQIFASYDEQTATPTEEMVAFKARFFGAVNGTVADLGCGPGRDLLAFSAMGLDVVGVDLSEGMFSVARTRGRVVRGDLRRPPLRPGALGGLWSSASLLHVPRPDVADTLRTWHPDALLELLTAAGFAVSHTERSASHRDWLMILAAAAS